MKNNNIVFDILKTLEKKFPKTVINFIAGFKLFALALWLLGVIVPMLAITYITRIGTKPLLKLWWIGAAFILRMKVEVDGKITTRRPLLCIGNHASYFDIFAVGKCFNTIFVAKSEMKKWPVIGTLMQMSGMMFIDRRRSKAAGEVNMMEEALNEEASPVMLYPEGTTSNGNEVKPFKSSIFSIVENQMQDLLPDEDKEYITIQPMVIVYTHNKKKKLKAKDRDIYAWYIQDDGTDEPLLPHIFRAMKKGVFTVRIKVLPPVPVSKFKNRKDLTEYCHKEIEKEFNKMIK